MVGTRRRVDRAGERNWASASAIAVYNGDLIAGGDFTLANGSQAFHVARWDGTSWHPLGGGLLGTVNALAVYGGELIAAGGFITAGGGTPVNNIARWNGSQWLPLGTGIAGAVAALRVFGAELVAIGAFSSAGGVAANNIAKWDGASWQALGGGLTGGYGTSLASTATISLPAAPSRTPAASPRPASRSGMALRGSRSPAPTNGGVRALTVLGGELFAASTGWVLPSGVTTGVARWNGSSWQPLGSGMDPGNGVFSSGVSALVTYRGSVIAGGDFASAGGIGSPFIARWSSPTPFLGISQPAGPGTGVIIANHWLVPGHEYYNLASLDPCAAGPGTGPYGGLCFADPATLINQLLAPIGAVPFHFVAGAADAAFGPFLLPPGLAVEALSVDVTGGVIGCISPVTSFTTQ